MSWDISVSSDGGTQSTEVSFLGGDGTEYAPVLTHEEPETLRDMATDALEHLDDCRRAHAATSEAPETSHGWNLYLQSALNRRNQ